MEQQRQALSVAASPSTKHTKARLSVTSLPFYFGLKLWEGQPPKPLDRPGTGMCWTEGGQQRQWGPRGSSLPVLSLQALSWEKSSAPGPLF